MVRLRVWVDDRSARRYLKGLVRRTQNFRSVLRWAQRELEKANRENFATQGLASGAPWMPLDNEYARWKLAHYGPLPTLIRTGDLYRDVTFLRGTPNDIGPKKAVFGTDIPYAKFHQYGTSKMAQRKIIFVPRLFALRLAERVGQYVVYGKESGALLRRLKGLFQH